MDTPDRPPDVDAVLEAGRQAIDALDAATASFAALKGSLTLLLDRIEQQR